MLFSYFPGQQQPILNFVASLESIPRRVEAQFPHARAFVRPGLDEEINTLMSDVFSASNFPKAYFPT
jgi:hypothetical protein